MFFTIDGILYVKTFCSELAANGTLVIKVVINKIFRMALPYVASLTVKTFWLVSSFQTILCA